MHALVVAGTCPPTVLLGACSPTLLGQAKPFVTSAAPPIGGEAPKTNASYENEMASREPGRTRNPPRIASLLFVGRPPEWISSSLGGVVFKIGFPKLSNQNASKGSEIPQSNNVGPGRFVDVLNPETAKKLKTLGLPES